MGNLCDQVSGQLLAELDPQSPAGNLERGPTQTTVPVRKRGGRRQGLRATSTFAPGRRVLVRRRSIPLRLRFSTSPTSGPPGPPTGSDTAGTRTGKRGAPGRQSSNGRTITSPRGSADGPPITRAPSATKMRACRPDCDGPASPSGLLSALPSLKSLSSLVPMSLLLSWARILSVEMSPRGLHGGSLGVKGSRQDRLLRG